MDNYQYKVGDLVMVIKKCEGRDDYPFWTYIMTKMIGNVYIIESISKRGALALQYKHNSSSYWFHRDSVVLVTDYVIEEVD